MLQPLLEALVHEGVEEVDLVGALLHDGADDVLDHGLGHVHVALEVAEGHLRLDHPELGGVALGVGILRPEGGAEGIHVAEGHGEVLSVELAGDGQVGGLAKEVLAVVHLAVLGAGWVLHVQGGHPEHLAGALAVGGGDDGGVDIDEAPVLEEAVDGVGRHAPHPEGGGEQVGAGPQVGDGAQVLHAVALFLEGVLGGGGALHCHGGGLHLQGLLGLRGEYHSAGDGQGRAHVLSGDLPVVVQGAGVQDDLQVLEAGAVVELHEAEGLHIPDGAGPAGHEHLFPAELLLVGKDLCNFYAFHWSLPLFLKIKYQWVVVYHFSTILQGLREKRQDYLRSGPPKISASRASSDRVRSRNP